MQNPERIVVNGCNHWKFRCEGPGHTGDGCTAHRYDVANTQRDAELIALQNKWELVARRWHCPQCVIRVDDAMYGADTRVLAR